MVDLVRRHFFGPSSSRRRGMRPNLRLQRTRLRVPPSGQPLDLVPWSAMELMVPDEEHAVRDETRDRPANAAHEHHHQTHRAREAAPGAERAQTLYQLERRPTGERAQFQILS